MERRLLADSGSTKTDWVILENSVRTLRCSTQGINPYMLSDDEIEKILELELLPNLDQTEFDEVNFYGAGCRGEQCEIVERVLRSVLKVKHVTVDSDLVGAAKALCGDEAGIACILGTGSNSCLYDGTQILSNVSPLGFILGDEGSGAVLGKRFIGNLFKGQFPNDIEIEFKKEYPYSLDVIISKVYREKFPNRFLASFCPFIHKHKGNPEIRQLILDEFSRFLERNVANYHRKDLPVHFVGSVAYYFREELEEALANHGFCMGIVKRAPLDQ